MISIYGDYRSGNCYKVQLLLSLLDIHHRWFDIDLFAGETRSDAFIARNPNSKIPLLELHDGRMLAESNAILNYLGCDSEFIPQGPFEHARMLQWQFFEQYSHGPNIGVACFIARYLNRPAEREEEFQLKLEDGYKALAVMEKVLAEQDFLVGEHYTLADISLYAYTHMARECSFDFDDFPHIQAWLGRIESHPRHIPMGIPN
ncbi:glutathione S-transferase family protein [Phytohalomonas tamaricis]|uniref:glutathione S-transferase family protein n=1 Tax=Phytohalomonas tamaricis TaxID=2081032 RepID=UPI000D0B1626|nr:glutathione S-transferase family protein [Phytohalomonas tamaricis]